MSILRELWKLAAHSEWKQYFMGGTSVLKHLGYNFSLYFYLNTYKSFPTIYHLILKHIQWLCCLSNYLSSANWQKSKLYFVEKVEFTDLPRIIHIKCLTYITCIIIRCFFSLGIQIAVHMDFWGCENTIFFFLISSQNVTYKCYVVQNI